LTLSSVKSLSYYTPEELASLLVSLIPKKNVFSVLDMCVGSGNLLWAARRKWPSASLVGVDVDLQAVINCRKRFEQPATFVQADARLMHPSAEGKPKELKGKTFDIVLANPPFAGNRERAILVTKDSKYSDRRDTAALPEKWGSLAYRVEAMLLVYNLLYVRSGGYLAAIMPDSILSCDRFVSLRNWLIKQTFHLNIVKLPPNSFSQTEVAASAIIVKREERSKLDSFCNFVLQEARFEGGRMLRRTIHRGVLNGSCGRLDEACIPDCSSVSDGIKLADLMLSIKRGTFIPKQSLGTSGPYFYVHSTNIRNTGLDMVRAPKFIIANNKAIESGVEFKCGDILLVRVGRTLGRVNVVTNKEQANGYISSCLYRLRPKGIDSYTLALLLLSNAVQDYYRKTARGSGAKFLTYSDVKSTPIRFISDRVVKRLGASYKDLLHSNDLIDKEKANKELRIQQLINKVNRRLDVLNQRCLQRIGSVSEKTRRVQSLEH